MYHLKIMKNKKNQSIRKKVVHEKNQVIICM